MGNQLSPLVVSNNPVPTHPQARYQYRCDTTGNERRAFCQDQTFLSPVISSESISLFPNPAITEITISNISENMIIQVFNHTGLLMTETNRNKINVSFWPSGLYLVKVNGATLLKNFKFEVVH